MTYETLLTEKKDRSMVITINRPEKRNALSTQCLRDIIAAIQIAENDYNINGIIITGQGDTSFVSGADISEFTTLDRIGAEKLAHFGQDTLRRIETCSKPVLAAINGFAYGGGCELAMACHLRIASENASFSQPEVNLGIMAGYGGTQRLIQYIGKTRAMEMHLTGKVITAQEALDWGLLNDVVPTSELMTRSFELMNTIATKSPQALSRIIRSLNSYFENEVNGYDSEIEEFGKCFESDDFREGIAAFFEKRKPDFRKNK